MQAEYNCSTIEENRNKKWGTYNKDRHDLEMAKDILRVLSYKNTLQTSQELNRKRENA